MRTPVRLLHTTLALLIFISASAYAQTTDLVGVVISGTPQDVQAAINKGANVNAQGDMTPLIAAARYNQEAITTLLKAGADTNAQDAQYGATALMWVAAYAKTSDAITALLKAGANIAARDLAHGATALIFAAEFNQNADVITTLLEAGAEVNVQDKGGGTALIAAAKGNNLGVIVALLNAGADAKVKDSIGNMAFDYAKYNSLLKDTDALKQLEEKAR